MRRLFFTLAILIPMFAAGLAAGAGWFHSQNARASATCMPTGFIRDSINLTAAMIVNTSGSTTGGTVNAAGCNIGIYVSHGIAATFTGVEVFGANYFGIVNDGGNVTVKSSRIHDIGENPLNGTQHGVAVYFVYGSKAKGSVSGSVIWNYQKGGIVVNGLGTTANISKNTVLGQGPVNYIAQNGIQIGFGAKATVSGNLVSGNSYTGLGNAASGGIIVVGGSCYSGALTIGSKVTGNIVVGNDVGVWLSNLDGSTCIPTLTPTNITINGNISTNDGINNVSGDGSAGGYQAGISDQGDDDVITNNSVCGLGYTPAAVPPPYLYLIDTTATNNPTVSGNTSCLDGSSIDGTGSTSVKVRLHSKHLVSHVVR